MTSNSRRSGCWSPPAMVVLSPPTGPGASCRTSADLTRPARDSSRHSPRPNAPGFKTSFAKSPSEPTRSSVTIIWRPVRPGVGPAGGCARATARGVPLVVMAAGDFARPLVSPAEPGSRLTPAGTPIEVADVIIAERIAIGFTLASCVNNADDMAVSRVAQVAADLDRIVQRLDNSRTQPDQAWALNPAWASPSRDPRCRG